jgi:branched-chain amino acid transport system substrate-binding protein
MKSRLLGAMLALTLTTALALAVGACKRESDTIKIGVGGPMTGPVAKFGEQLTNGAKAAAEAINAAGGIKGKKIELVLGDDACEPKQAQTVANSLVNSKVVAVVGHYCSSSSIPASVVYAENNILQITPASTNPLFTERGLATVFRTCGRDDQQGDVAGDFIADKLKAKRIAVIHDKSTYGQGLANATRDRLNSKHKLKEVLYEGINQGEKDFSSLVTKLKGLKVDAIFFGGYHPEAGLIVRQAYEQGLKAKFVSGDALATDEFASIVGNKKATIGVMNTFGADPTLLPEAKAAVDALKKANINPEGYTLYTYAAMQIVAKALEANDLSRDGKKLAEWIRSHPVETVMGRKEFDSKGDLKTSDYVMYRWQEMDGKITYKQM